MKYSAPKLQLVIGIIIIISLAIIITLIVSQPSNLAQFEPYPSIEQFNEIRWNGNLYSAFANAAYNNYFSKNRDHRIGYIKDGEHLKIYSIKNHPPTDWFIMLHHEICDVYKNDAITEIPGNLLLLHVGTYIGAVDTLYITHTLDGEIKEYIITNPSNLFPILQWTLELNLLDNFIYQGYQHPGIRETYKIHNNYFEISYIMLYNDTHYIQYQDWWYPVADKAGQYPHQSLSSILATMLLFK